MTIHSSFPISLLIPLFFLTSHSFSSYSLLTSTPLFSPLLLPTPLLFFHPFPSSFFLLFHHLFFYSYPLPSFPSIFPSYPPTPFYGYLLSSPSSTTFPLLPFPLLFHTSFCSFPLLLHSSFSLLLSLSSYLIISSPSQSTPLLPCSPFLHASPLPSPPLVHSHHPISFSNESELFYKVSAHLKNWAHVLNFVNKAESSIEIMGEVSNSDHQWKQHVKLLLLFNIVTYVVFPLNTKLIVIVMELSKPV